MRRFDGSIAPVQQRQTNSPIPAPPLVLPRGTTSLPFSINLPADSTQQADSSWNSSSNFAVDLMYHRLEKNEDKEKGWEKEGRREGPAGSEWIGKNCCPKNPCDKPRTTKKQRVKHCTKIPRWQTTHQQYDFSVQCSERVVEIWKVIRQITRGGHGCFIGIACENTPDRRPVSRGCRVAALDTEICGDQKCL